MEPTITVELTVREAMALIFFAEEDSALDSAVEKLGEALAGEAR